MTHEIVVDLEHLKQLVTRLSGLSGYLSDHLDQLDNKVRGLQVSWQGAASQAYQDAHEQWSAGAKEFTEGVDAMSKALRKVIERYNSASETDLRMLNGG